MTYSTNPIQDRNQIFSIRIAIPNKGRISIPIRELIEQSGLGIFDNGERTLIARTRDPHVEILYARPIDIPEYVASGVADLGITGHDMVIERSSHVTELLDLGFGNASVVLAVPDDSALKTPKDLEGKRVSTEFPAITRKYFKKIGVIPKIIPVGGACEATPSLGISDAIVDLASSGTTLRQNHLQVIDTVLDTSTFLIANPLSCTSKKEKIDEIHLALESVINAKGKCYLMMNVKRTSVDTIRTIIPGMGGPTIMEVASSSDIVAVHAVVDEEKVYQLINRLKQAGAKDILVMNIERLIR
ncbi:ATP phosphoribosyltransferase [Methanospirillum stamsii]|uniref:ATP phosphoribosyltransferase n=1 Tax=Methanospirillum stamsii TaxID=1277351 RepID=A0A2V2NIX7_9EURY|nr:ATP phosphoribosyltransferase [Methanospirillum stamsii]PWR75283.1 ATP phosphoribosyltransferase [Methanospirillum stamsii]